jgi:AcrR family transcriptional regulator
VPSTVKKRRYLSPVRRAKADATRGRIIDAATKLFLDAGYGPTSTSAIGKAARTSEASIFAIFGSKADLLVEVVRDHVVRHSDFPLRDQPVWRSLATAPDKTPAIDLLSRAVRRAHDRSWRLLAVAAAAAQDDANVATAVARAAQQRHADCAWFVREIIGISGPDVGRRTDEVWTLISVDNYRHLVVERKWPPKRYETWLSAMISGTLAVTRATGR